jgi:hypothetical protein
MVYPAVNVGALCRRNAPSRYIKAVCQKVDPKEPQWRAARVVVEVEAAVIVRIRVLTTTITNSTSQRLTRMHGVSTTSSSTRFSLGVDAWGVTSLRTVAADSAPHAALRAGATLAKWWSCYWAKSGPRRCTREACCARVVGLCTWLLCFVPMATLAAASAILL